MKEIIWILMAAMGIACADFSRSSAGIVTDSTTGIEWQDDYSDNDGDVKSAKWQDAIDYCESLMLDGGGWRLPNIRELNSITDLTRYNPAISPIFQHTTSSHYWSSTSEHRSNYAWQVENYYGYCRGAFNKDNNFDIRCNRAGQ